MRKVEQDEQGALRIWPMSSFEARAVPGQHGEEQTRAPNRGKDVELRALLASKPVFSCLDVSLGH